MVTLNLIKLAVRKLLPSSLRIVPEGVASQGRVDCSGKTGLVLQQTGRRRKQILVWFI